MAQAETRIRRAYKRDISEICRIAQVLRLPIRGFYWHERAVIAPAVRCGQFFVAIDSNDEVVGILWLRAHSRNSFAMVIESLAVAPERKGQGIGTALVEFAKRIAKGSRKVTLAVNSFWQYGVKDFYLKQGFHLLEPVGVWNGHKYHRFIMSLSAVS